MKTINLNVFFLLFAVFLIETTSMQAQAIKVNSLGAVGINGEPYSSSAYPLKVYGRIYVTNGIYNSSTSNLSGFNQIYGIEKISSSYPMEINFTNSLIKMSNGTEGWTGGTVLYVNGDIQTPSGYVQTSDKRIKKDIQSLNGPSILDKLTRIEGKTYKLKSYEELVAMHGKDGIYFDADTIDLMQQAEMLAMQDKNFIEQTKGFDSKKQKKL